MPGDFKPADVRVTDRHLQLIRCDVVVGLERGHAFGSPVVHGASCVVSIGQLMHLKRECALAFEVRDPSRRAWGPGINPASICFFSSRSV
jgi:hypothetical protein